MLSKRGKKSNKKNQLDFFQNAKSLLGKLNAFVFTRVTVIYTVYRLVNTALKLF